MGDIRQSLLPRDVLSAAKELLYHLDIYICNLLQSGRQPPQVDSKTLELVEEFILHAPKDRSAPARVRLDLTEPRRVPAERAQSGERVLCLSHRR